MSKSWLSKRLFCLLFMVGAAGWSPATMAEEASEWNELEGLINGHGETAADEPAASPATESSTTTPDQAEQSTEAEAEVSEVGNVHKVRAARVEEIVVTARKREETVQDVPLSVTPFTAGDLERRGFTGLDDIAASTPGFTFEGFMTGGAHGNPVIRGLAQQFTTSRIQNVSFFLDGVYLQRQSMLNLGMVDMERIEVVKGPQNALYGRNAFGGAVNYITKRPSAEPEGYFFAGSGDNSRLEYRVSLSGALNDANTLFGKFTAGMQEYEGHTKNNHPVADADPPGPNQRGNLGGWDDQTYSLSLSWEPSERLHMRGSYYRTEMQRETAPGYSISGVNAARFGLRFDNQNDLNCNLATVPNIQPYPPREHTGFSAYCGELPYAASDIAPRTKKGIIVDPRAVGTLANTDALTFVSQFELSPEMTLHYLYGYAEHESYTDGGASDEDPLAGRGIATNALITSIDSQNPAGYSFVNTASSRPNSELEVFSHELRLDWEVSDVLRTSFGAYYSVVEDEEWTALFLNDLCNGSSRENIDNCNEPLSAPNSLASQTVLTSGVAYDQYVRQHGGKLRGEWTAFKDEVAAIFASFSYNFTERLEGTLEARYTVEDKAVERFTDSFMLRPGETVTYNPIDENELQNLLMMGAMGGNGDINPAGDPVLPAGNSLTSSIVVPKDAARYKYFTPRGILNWHYHDDRMVYFTVAKGVKSGGFNNADDPSELTYAEAENWTYELGSKNSFFYNSFTLNGAIYYIDWTGLQGGVPPSVAGLSTSDIITNIGGATSTGIEIESSLRFRNGVSIDVGLTYNEAQYNDGVKYSAGDQKTGSFRCDGVTCPADGDVSGNQLARTSKEQYSLGLNYHTDYRGWLIGARIDTSYQSRQYITPLNLAWVPDRQLYNASFNFTSPDDRWEVVWWGKNLTDEKYAANSFYIGVFNQYMAAVGPGRTFGTSVKYHF